MGKVKTGKTTLRTGKSVEKRKADKQKMAKNPKLIKHGTSNKEPLFLVPRKHIPLAKAWLHCPPKHTLGLETSQWGERKEEAAHSVERSMEGK